MRAWLLLLAVLATFHPIVQVASTEDTITTFIVAISPTSQIESIAATPADSMSTIMTVPTSTTIGLSSAFNNPVTDIGTKDSSLILISSVSKVTTVSTMATAITNAAMPATVLDENSDSDNKINKHSENHNDNHNHNKINEIENIESNVIAKVTNNQVHENRRTKDQLNISKSNQISTNLIIHNTYNHNYNKNINSFNEAYTSAGKEMHHHKKNAPGERSTSEVVLKDQQSQTHTQYLGDQLLNISSVPTISTSVAVHSTGDERRSASTAAVATDPLEMQEKEAEKADQVIAEDISSDATYSNRDIISEKVKPDPSTLVEIENSLLSLFNMKRPPKIDRSKIIIPEAMKQLYAQIMGHEIDSVNIPKPGLLTKSANTVRSFTHKESKIDDRFPHHHRFRLHFDIRSIPAEEKLKAAELQLSREAISHTVLHPRLRNRTRYQVLVYDITRVGIRGKREPTYLLLDNKTIRLNRTDTVSLDVQPAVDRWLVSPKKNYGLLVEVRTMHSLEPAPHQHVRLRRSAGETHDSWQHKQPILFTYTDDGRHKARSIRDVSARSKRAGHHRRAYRRKSTDEICRRHSLYVDFTDVGWSDWIVAPPGYDAFYCHGKCPFPLAEHLNTTNHAVVQTLVNNVNPGKVPKPCCVPTQLEGISMLYLNDQSTVVLKNYQDMTAVGCGCR